jgi:hypothetical protein
MSSRLSVIFYAILCLEIGIVLTVLPWVPHGWLWGLFGDWGNNYFLLLVAHKTGYGIQRFVASGWVRGAVSGLGVLNIAMGAWELVNFSDSVRRLEAATDAVPPRKLAVETVTNDEGRPVKTDPLSDYPRRNR